MHRAYSSDYHGGHLFQHEYEYICNEPVLKNYLNAFFNTEGYVYQNFKPVIETLSTNKSTQSNYLKNLIKCIFLNHKRINKSAFFIHDYWYEGYFHWNMDALPKLYFISQDTNLKNAKLIIPNYYLKIKYIKESLLLLSFNEKNFIWILLFVIKKEKSTIFKKRSTQSLLPIKQTSITHSFSFSLTTATQQQQLVLWVH